MKTLTIPFRQICDKTRLETYVQKLNICVPSLAKMVIYYITITTPSNNVTQVSNVQRGGALPYMDQPYEE